jgi:hypothetical protein
MGDQLAFAIFFVSGSVYARSGFCLAKREFSQATRQLLARHMSQMNRDLRLLAKVAKLAKQFYFVAIYKGLGSLG